MAGAVQSEEALAAKFAALLPHLDERQRRLLMGAEARSLGHGGIKTVARAAGVSAVTVSRGVDELEAGGKPLGRTRKPGGGRKPVTHTDPVWVRRCRRWWSRDRAGIRSRRCGGRRSRCGSCRASWPRPGTRCRCPRWPSCSRPTGTACRPTPRRSRAPSIPIATPSSATSTTRPATTSAPATR